jgi:hypothetical protein
MGIYTDCTYVTVEKEVLGGRAGWLNQTEGEMNGAVLVRIGGAADGGIPPVPMPSPRG